MTCCDLLFISRLCTEKQAGLSEWLMQLLLNKVIKKPPPTLVDLPIIYWNIDHGRQHNKVWVIKQTEHSGHRVKLPQAPEKGNPKEKLCFRHEFRVELQWIGSESF